MAIELPEQTKAELIHSIKRYFLEERDEELGDLQAGFLLAFFVEEMGPSIYNQALRDAQARVHHAVADLDVTLHEPELAYSAKKGGRR